MVQVDSLCSWRDLQITTMHEDVDFLDEDGIILSGIGITNKNEREVEVYACRTTETIVETMSDLAMLVL